jgi:predicted RecA/RadA family phage recombinase
MAVNEICKGDRMTYTNATGAAIASGDPVLVGKTLGVAVKDIAIGETETLHIERVFEIRKAATTVIAQGDNLYWDADGNPQGGTAGSGCLTNVATDNVYAGKAFAAAASTDSTVQIKLNV